MDAKTGEICVCLETKKSDSDFLDFALTAKYCAMPARRNRLFQEKRPRVEVFLTLSVPLQGADWSGI